MHFRFQLNSCSSMKRFVTEFVWKTECQVICDVYAQHGQGSGDFVENGALVNVDLPALQHELVQLVGDVIRLRYAETSCHAVDNVAVFHQAVRCGTQRDHLPHEDPKRPYVALRDVNVRFQGFLSCPSERIWIIFTGLIYS